MVKGDCEVRIQRERAAWQDAGAVKRATLPIASSLSFLLANATLSHFTVTNVSLGA